MFSRTIKPKKVFSLDTICKRDIFVGAPRYSWFSKKKTEEEDAVSTIVEQPRSMWFYLSEEEVMRIRDKSRLPTAIKNELKGIPKWDRLPCLPHYRKSYIKKYYAKYGAATGLKPGICYGTIEENQHKIEFEKTFYPDFQTLVKKEKDEKAAEVQRIAIARADIEKKLKDLPKAIEEFYKKHSQRAREAEEELAKREKLIQEVREYLGYNVAPGDSRFQEALTKKEAEEKAAAKTNKKQEKQAKMMASLAAMAEEEIQKAQKAAEPQTSDKKNVDVEADQVKPSTQQDKKK